MKKIVYAVYDSKMEMFHKPMFLITEGEAVRGFVDICKDTSSMLHKHSADYTLFRLGTFSEDKGCFENEKSPTRVITAWEAVNYKEERQ